jgi:carboxymethylenebutenolidase
MRNAMRAGTVTITGHGGDEIEAYTAQPEDGAALGGVVIIHHLPGYDEATKEYARTFAVHGYNAVVPNLYWREAPGADPSDAAASARASGGVPDERLVGDVAGGAAYLRGLTSSNGKVGVIGHCSGGRQSVLAACSLDLQAVVDCYGAFVMLSAPGETGMKATSLVDDLPNLSCPLLGLFGGDDTYPSPDQNAEMAAILDKHGKTHEIHTYEGAGHAFFNVNRVSYRPEAAMDGWEKIFAFYGKHLS